MKRIFLILITISFVFNCIAADKDAAYQNYLQRCSRKLNQALRQYLLIRDLVNIVRDYNCISYDQWQKNGQDLINAAKIGDIEKVKDLLQEAEVGINAIDNNKRTPLMWAATNGHKEIVELLINANGGVNDKDINNITALHFASLNGYKDIVKFLIQANADINAKTDTGATALMQAARKGHKPIVELLIDAHADINLVHNFEGTASIMAAKRGHKEIVELLKKAGATT